LIYLQDICRQINTEGFYLILTATGCHQTEQKLGDFVLLATSQNNTGLSCTSSTNFYENLHSYTVAKRSIKITKSNLQISSFRREIDEICVLLRYYTAFFLDFLILEGGTDRLYRKFGKELPLHFNTIRCVISQQSADLSKLQTLWEIHIFESPRPLLLFASD
jgi:hypothetical protein